MDYNYIPVWMERWGSQNWFRGELLWINSRKRAVLDCLCVRSLSLFVYLYFVVRVSHRAKREFEKEINKKESKVGLGLFVVCLWDRFKVFLESLSLSSGGKVGNLGWTLFVQELWYWWYAVLLWHGKVFSVGHTMPNSFIYICFSKKKNSFFYI